MFGRDGFTAPPEMLPKTTLRGQDVPQHKPTWLWVFFILFWAFVWVAPWWEGSAQGAARVSLSPASAEVGEGQTAAVQVWVRDVQDLYGLDIRLQFDPNVVEVMDEYPQQAGVQMRPGDFLSVDFIIRNTADNEEGTLWYALTQVNPTQPRSGSGVVLIIRFKGKQLGETSALTFTRCELATRTGATIPCTTEDGSIRVVPAQEAPPTPTQAPPPPEPTILMPTPTNTPYGAPSPTPTRTRTPTFTPGATGAATATPTRTGLPSPTASPTATAAATRAPSPTAGGPAGQPTVPPTAPPQATQAGPSTPAPTATAAWTATPTSLAAAAQAPTLAPPTIPPTLEAQGQRSPRNISLWVAIAAGVILAVIIIWAIMRQEKTSGGAGE